MPKNRRALAAPKTGQLQIRVSRAQKLAIQRQARKARMSMSEWILRTLLPSAQASFQTLVSELAATAQTSYAFAELLDFLAPLEAEAFEAAVAEPPAAALDPYWQNYLAATVEQAAAKKQAKVPAWTREIPPLAEPHFGSSLASLRLHLLLNSPPPFVARNLFIDANVGDRV
jgi:uncharacterized protein (DUF1778 family)